MKKDIYAEVDLPTGEKMVVFEGYGCHLFKAIRESKNEPSLIIKSLIMQLAQLNGKELSAIDVDNMPIRDISYLSELITAMMSNDFRKGV